MIYATLKVKDATADLTEKGWVSEQQALAETLNKYYMDVLPGYYPNPYLAHAEYMANILHGKVINVAKLEHDPDLVY